MKARVGTKDFDTLMEDLRECYVDAHFPGLESYIYEAELLYIEDGEGVMEEILHKVVEIDWPDDGTPSLRLRGKDKWLSVEDSEDFPQPSTDFIEGEGEDEEEEEEAGEEE